MTSFKTIRLVAGREIRARIRSKAYLISSIAMVVLLTAAIVLPGLIGGDGETVHDVGVVGDPGDLLTTTESMADPENPISFDTTTFDDVTAAETALEAGEVELVIVDGSEMVTPGGGPWGDFELAGLLQQAAAAERVEELVASDASEEVVSLLTSQPLTVRSLEENDATGSGANLALAIGSLVLTYVAVLTYGGWVLTGVTEEKTNRVVEVLLSSVKPWQLLTGKLVGIGALGLAQFALTIVVALVAMNFSTTFELPTIPVGLGLTLLLWFILGFTLYAALFGAAGALVSRAEEAQSSAAPMTIFAIAGYIFAWATVSDPSGTMAMVGTYVPFVSPYVIPVRLAFEAIPLWEMLAAVGVMLVTITLMLRFAGRVYAGGLLNFGAKSSFRQAFRSAER